MTFSVLLVCTGNICRSPLGERLLQSRLPATAPITVSSVGTHAVLGMGIDAPSALALRDLGVESDGHAARPLTAAEIGDADVILTAESAHRSVVVRADPPAFRKTFTMREFGRLGAALPPLDVEPTPDQLRARVALIADQRGVVEVAVAGADEIGDPYGARAEVARQTAADIAAAVDAIVSALGLPLAPRDRGPDGARGGGV